MRRNGKKRSEYDIGLQCLNRCRASKSYMLRFRLKTWSTLCVSWKVLICTQTKGNTNNPLFTITVHICLTQQALPHTNILFHTWTSYLEDHDHGVVPEAVLLLALLALTQQAPHTCSYQHTVSHMGIIPGKSHDHGAVPEAILLLALLPLTQQASHCSFQRTVSHMGITPGIP